MRRKHVSIVIRLLEIILMKITNNSIKPRVNFTSANLKDKNDKYVDPLKTWPIKGLAYSNELGAVVSGISPKIGTALWVPALMYFGADIYDKYKNEDTQYNPSKRRGVKEAVFQAMASVFMPTAAVSLGQRCASSFNRLSKNGLSSQSKIDVIYKSIDYMQSKSLHTFVDNPESYALGFEDAILTTAKTSKDEFKRLSPFKKVLSFINPLKDSDTFAHANEQKLGDFAKRQGAKIMEMRAQLMQNQRPKEMSKKLFEKFQTVQSEYAKLYPADKYMGKAVKSILKDFHENQIFKNKMIKTAGGFIGLALLAKSIDNFVENIVIKKTVEPSLDYLSQEYKNTKSRFQQRISQPQTRQKSTNQVLL